MAASTTAPVGQHPVMKWVMNTAQVLFISFICWLGSNIASSVTAFSSKLDGVVTSIAAIAAEQAMQKRDAADMAQRMGKLEGKSESLEARVTRMGFQVEQLEKERTHGR